MSDDLEPDTAAVPPIRWGRLPADDIAERPDVESDDGEGEELGYPDVETPELSPDEFLIVRPGEPMEVADGLPRARHLPLALALRAGKLIVCEGRHRSTLRTPADPSPMDPMEPVAGRMVLVRIAHRADPPRTKPRLYLIVIGREGELLAWLDHSPPRWDFQLDQLQALARLAALECDVESYENEPQFEEAHAEWVG